MERKPETKAGSQFGQQIIEQIKRHVPVRDPYLMEGIESPYVIEKNIFGPVKDNKEREK